MSVASETTSLALQYYAYSFGELRGAFGTSFSSQGVEKAIERPTYLKEEEGQHSGFEGSRLQPPQAFFRELEGQYHLQDQYRRKGLDLHHNSDACCGLQCW